MSESVSRARNARIQSTSQRRRRWTHEDDPAALVALIDNLADLEPERLELAVDLVPELIPPGVARRFGRWAWQVRIDVLGDEGGRREEGERLAERERGPGEERLEEELDVQRGRHGGKAGVRAAEREPG